MKVKELIKKLKQVNPNLIVILEGCDCVNKADGNIYEGNKTLLISGGLGVSSYEKEKIDNLCFFR